MTDSRVQASSFEPLRLSPRPPPGENCTSPGFDGCAMLQPPPSVIREAGGGTSDPGTPFRHTDGEIYQVWGSRNQPRGVTIFLYKAPTADASLRKFEFDSVLFGRNFTPAQWCESYGPPPTCVGCACPEAYVDLCSTFFHFEPVTSTFTSPILLAP